MPPCRGIRFLLLGFARGVMSCMCWGWGGAVLTTPWQALGTAHMVVRRARPTAAQVLRFKYMRSPFVLERHGRTCCELKCCIRAQILVQWENQRTAMRKSGGQIHKLLPRVERIAKMG